MNNIEKLNITSAPHLDGGKPVFNNSVWLRLPRPGARCPITGLSRSSLAELVRPCPRNDFSPPVEARLLKRRTARRGVLLINRAALLTHIEGLPTPESQMQEGADVEAFEQKNPVVSDKGAATHD